MREREGRKEGRQGSRSSPVGRGCTCVPVQFVVFFNRFLGNALCTPLSICVDHFLLTDQNQNKNSDCQSKVLTRNKPEMKS